MLGFLQKIENLDMFPSKREISRSNRRTRDNLSKRESSIQNWRVGKYATVNCHHSVTVSRFLLCLRMFISLLFFGFLFCFVFTSSVCCHFFVLLLIDFHHNFHIFQLTFFPHYKCHDLLHSVHRGITPTSKTLPPSFLPSPP